MENTMIGKSLFTGRQVELTELDPEKDAQAISIWTKQPAFNRKFFNSTFKPRPMSEVKKKLQEMLKEADENRQAIYFAIRKINSPELIGMLWFPWVDAQHQTSSMYLSFGEREDLASLGQEALDLATYYAFMELSLHRLAVTLGADEPEWIALIEENGFLREVLRRENIFTEGHYLDEYVYAIVETRMEGKTKQEVMMKTHY